MKSIKFAFIAIAMFLSLIFNMSLLAQGIELSEAVTIEAEVYGIEKIDRTLWLIGPEGNIVEIDVSEDAKNFNQLNIGDIVIITYYESLALYLGIPGEKPEEQTESMIVRAPEGDTPGGAAVEVVDISATIVSIDKENRLLTLKGPLGNSLTTYVDESVSSFDNLEVGDVIHASYTKALAIDVELQ
jgi:hypothetical protein